MANVSSPSTTPLPQAQVSSAAFIVPLILALVFVSVIYGPSSRRSKSAIHRLGGIQILTAWTFFAKRYEFLQSNFQCTGEKLFQFRVLQHTVVAMSGEEARKIFFGDKKLNVTEGYRILLGGAPELSDLNLIEDEDEAVSIFFKCFHTVLSTNRVTNMLPALLDGMHKQMQAWGPKGRIDPFKKVYDLVFQMTIRMASCSELADDLEASARLAEYYWTLEQSATPVVQLLPWLPCRARRDKEHATRELYEMLIGYVEKRREADVLSADTIDVLIQDGINDTNIIQFVLGVIFAGVINSGMIACWILLYLDQNPEWKAKVSAEVHALLDIHTNSTDALYQRLAALPLSALEDDARMLELALRETIRIILGSGITLRRNVAGDLHVGDKVVPCGAFLTYSIGDVHFNPDIYTEPERFDPGRFQGGREEDKKTTFGYLGWGAGRHPCSGMKIAKMEVKMIVALFVAGYKYKVVDATGKFPDPFPIRDRNDLQKARPLGEPCFLEFERIMD